MQARPPPMNVILYVIQYTQVLVLKENTHRSVNSGHTSISDTLGQGGEPTLRLPLMRVISPQRVRAIDCCDSDVDHRMCWDMNLVHYLAILAFNGGLKR